MLGKDDIIAIIQSELSLADSSTYNGQGNVSLQESLSYYLGQTPGPAPEGKSQVNSTDVADAIEWIMPQVMKSFTQNNEIVIFDPVHEGDERQAELESEYVYEVLMKQNDGFIILHQFVKDALMQRNGILKVYYCDTTTTKTKDYTGITTTQLEQLLTAEDVELVEHTEYVDEAQTAQKQETLRMQMAQMQQQMGQMHQQPQPQQMAQMQQAMVSMQQQMQEPEMAHDVKVSVTNTRGQIRVDPVPPEEFRLNAQHNSINLDKARFTAHVLLKPASDIMEEFGISKDGVDELPEGANFYDREYRFSMQNESVFYDRVDSGDDSQRLIEISECFIRMDIDQTGISKLMKITVAGGDAPTELLKVEEVEHGPWVSTTAFLMSHKFQGLSITDRLKEIQNQKTALWRNMMDNMYLQNNQRNLVVDNMVNLDDMAVSRPGGIIRVKRLDAVTPLATPQLGQDAYNMMEYLDKVRAGRTGVDPDGGATPQDIGDRVGSQGVDRLMNAKEELVGLIIRVIAETGVKPLCTKIRDLSTQHVDSVVDFRFRGVWQQINPSEWLDRTSCTVRVGTGTGNHMAMVASLREVMAMQEKILSNPSQTILSESQVFTTIDDFCKFSGLNGANRYFIDPESPEGQKHASDVQQKNAAAKEEKDKFNVAMAESQIKLAEAENAKASAQLLASQAKAKSDADKNDLQLQKQIYEGQLKLLQQELDEAKAIADNMGKTEELELHKYEIDQRTALELTRIESAEQTDENGNYEENKDTVSE